MRDSTLGFNNANMAANVSRSISSKRTVGVKIHNPALSDKD